MAYHEAGHAVVAVTLGVGVREVSMGDGKTGHTDYEHTREQMTRELGALEGRRRYALAIRGGQAAQERWRPGIASFGCEDDWAQYLMIDRPVLCAETGEDRGVWDDRIVNQIRELVDARWLAIEALALELLDHKCLSGEEAVAKIKAAT